MRIARIFQIGRMVTLPLVCRRLTLLDSFVLMGHSFGGKVSLAFASMYDVEKLVLFASPYKPEIEKLSLKTKFLKRVAKINILKHDIKDFFNK